MKKVSDQVYVAAQQAELNWWRNNHINVQHLWAHYFEKFGPFMYNFKEVADVGCGPIPIFCSPLIQAKKRIAVDPHFSEYCDIEYYAQYCRGEIEWISNPSDVWSNTCDAVFCLNALDHVQDPEAMLVHLWRMLKLGGTLFLFVDLDKKPDHMHPHTIAEDWLKERLNRMKPSLWLTEKSWKFPNDVLYYVGEKL